MTDDDPAVDVHLTNGLEVRSFSLLHLESLGCWVHVASGAGVRITAIRSREKALAYRRALDDAVATLIADGWYPAR